MYILWSVGTMDWLGEDNKRTSNPDLAIRCKLGDCAEIIRLYRKETFNSHTRAYEFVPVRVED